jgi:hypothetical protein
MIYLLIDLEKSRNLDFAYLLNLVFFPLIILISAIIVKVVKALFKDKSVWVVGA